MTDGTVDSDEQIVDPEYARKAMADWYETAANVRQMHSTNLPPAGKGIMLEHRDGDGAEGGEWVRSRVVEPTAVKLCDEGVYGGYSVGIARPRIVRDARARGGRIVGGRIVEISLVDRPANYNAKFALAKADRSGRMAYVGKVVSLRPAEVDPAPRAPRIREGSVIKITEADGSVATGRVVTAGARWARIDTLGYGGTGIELVDRRGASVEKYSDSQERDDHGRWSGGGSGEGTRSWQDRVPPAHQGREGHDVHLVLNGGANVRGTVSSVTPDKTVFRTGATTAGSSPGMRTNGDPPQTYVDHSEVAQIKDYTTNERVSPNNIVLGTVKAQAGPNPADMEDSVADDADTTKGADLASAAENIADAADDLKDAAGDLGDTAGGDDSDDGDDSDADKAAKGKVPPQFLEHQKPKAGADAPADGAADDDSADKAAGRKCPSCGGMFGDSDKCVKCGKAWTTDGTDDAEKAERKAAKAARKAAKAAAAKIVAAPGDGEEVSYLVRRAHDVTCGAYGTDALAAAYPSVEKRLGDALGASARDAAYAALASEVREGGTPAGIVALGKAISALDALSGHAEALAAAREGLVEAFRAANKDAAEPVGLPSPSETITPGQFRRGYISEGHQDQGGTGHPHATIPSATHPLDPASIDRGPLTDGHQRYLASKMAEVHDGLADWRPELCLMDAGGSNAFDRQPYPSPSQRPPALPSIPNRSADSGPVPVVAVPAAAPVAKTYTPEEFEAALSKATAPLATKIANLEQAYEDLASSPDTTAAAPRGLRQPSASDKLATADAAKAARKARKAEKRSRRAGFYEDLAGSSDPVTRNRAVDWLARHGRSIN